MSNTIKFSVYNTRLVKEEGKVYEIAREKCSSPDTVAKAMDDVFGLSSSPDEKIVALFFDAKLCVIGASLLSIGVLDAAMSSPRSVMRTALLMNAHSVIIGHNHPSGHISPSRDDGSNFEMMKEAGKLMGVKVLDSLIVGRGKCYSLFSGEEYYY